ncbi:MAG: hypothetical protein Q4C08_03705 [Pseudomonadota bacterium]|nr:hypothetical protein [Pseudomonadota bacterium]
MKKLILFLFMLIIAPVQSAQIANVEYIHTAIADKWDITIPYNREITNVGVAANMKYLLTAVDVANEILNGEKTTDYGNGEFATMVATDTVATDTAVETLVKKEEKYKFFITTTPDTSSFNFSISAAGEFYIDWGDGNTETIEKPDTTDTLYAHKYDTAGIYDIKLGGMATTYNSDTIYASVSFHYNTNLASIDGSLGAIFGTLADGSQPSFLYTFCGTKITSIPANLFSGIFGQPVANMFSSTFKACRDLTGPIPENLFGRLSGVPTESMFWDTFAFCTGITSIPENLFGNLSGAAPKTAFAGTFAGCTGLTGPSARINGKYLYEIFSGAGPLGLGGAYCGATGLSDYATMPSDWNECLY